MGVDIRSDVRRVLSGHCSNNVQSSFWKSYTQRKENTNVFDHSMLFVHSLRVLKPFPSRRFVSSRFSVRSMHVVQRSIELTPSERALFDVLQGTKKHYELDVTLRCAGGWVRDKLLGKHSDDIDVALDKMLGAEFAEKVQFLFSCIVKCDF